MTSRKVWIGTAVFLIVAALLVSCARYQRQVVPFRAGVVDLPPA